MSEKVKRYELIYFINRGGEPDAKLTPANEGEWVPYADYAAQEDETKALCAHRDALEADRDDWKEKAQEFNDAYLETARKLDAYMWDTFRRPKTSLWKRIIRRYR